MRFNEWMKEPINLERDGAAHKDISKLTFVAQEVLTHLIVHHGWVPDATMERFVAAGTEFGTVITSYARYLEAVRQVSNDYIAKQLRDLRHPIKWAYLQEWEWGTAEAEEMTRVLKDLNKLCRQYGSPKATAWRHGVCSVCNCRGD